MPPHHTHEMMNPLDPPGLPQGVPQFHLHYIKLTFLRQEGFCLFLHISCKTSHYVNLKQKKNLPEGVGQNMSQKKAKIFEFWEFCYFSCGMWNTMGKNQAFVKITFLWSRSFNFGPKEPKRAKIEEATLEKSYLNKSLVFSHSISHSTRKITKFSKLKNFGLFWLIFWLTSSWRFYFCFNFTQ